MSKVDVLSGFQLSNAWQLFPIFKSFSSATIQDALRQGMEMIHSIYQKYPNCIVISLKEEHNAPMIHDLENLYN
jgi:hypothetical protein